MSYSVLLSSVHGGILRDTKSPQAKALQVIPGMKDTKSGVWRSLEAWSFVLLLSLRQNSNVYETLLDWKRTKRKNIKNNPKANNIEQMSRSKTSKLHDLRHPAG